MIEYENRIELTNLLIEVLHSAKHFRLKVIGNSMLPFICIGDRLVVREVEKSDLHPGSILVFNTPAGLLTHRLVGRSIQGWLTKGDNLLDMDLPVAEHDILGVIERIEYLNGGQLNLSTPLMRLTGRVIAWVSQGLARLYRAYKILSGKKIKDD
jgi:signal peptidase I